MKFRFPDEEDARRFVALASKAQKGFAFFRTGTDVTVIDPFAMYARELLRIARECGGEAR